MNKTYIKLNSAVFSIMLGGTVISGVNMNNYNNYSVKGSMPISYYDSEHVAFCSNLYDISQISKAADDDMETLNEFVCSIINNSKSLDSDFSSLIDENFWDLV